MSALKSAVESGQADDEHVREYYLLHLQKWIGISLEEIESIDQEIKIERKRLRKRAINFSVISSGQASNETVCSHSGHGPSQSIWSSLSKSGIYDSE